MRLHNGWAPQARMIRFMPMYDTYMQQLHGWHCTNDSNPDNKVHGANMGPIWGRQGPGGPLVGPMNFAIWE